MRAAEHSPRSPRRLLVRRHGFAEVVERGVGVPAERRRVNRSHPGDVAALARERALRNPGLFSADGLFAPTEEPDFEFDGDGELDELTSADFGEDPYLHVDT